MQEICSLKELFILDECDIDARYLLLKGLVSDKIVTCLHK